jgi:hypothetical protein
MAMAASVCLFSLAISLISAAPFHPSVLFSDTWAADRPNGLSLFTARLKAAGLPGQEEKPAPAGKVKLSGVLNMDSRWMKHGDFTDKTSPSSTDLYIRKIEAGLEGDFADWVSVTAVLNSEWLQDPLNQGDEKVAVDEAHLDLNIPGTPFFLVAGKKDQPFGLFENYLITDPMTMDAYETKKVGLTAGLNGPLDSSLALSFYKGTEQMDHLFQSGLFDAGAVTRMPGGAPAKVDSFVVSASLSPAGKYLTLFSAYLSEPGYGQRNTTLNLGWNFLLPSANLLFDGEYMKALSREIYKGGDRSIKETVLSLTASYVFILRERTVKGGGTYRGRKSHHFAHPVEVAARYEHFDDDGMSALFDSWSTRSRMSLGGRFTFYEQNKTAAYVEAELRRQDYRIPSELQPAMAAANTEFYLMVGVDF